MTAPRGRLLGVDFGTVRIGLAITDPDRLVASPLETYTRNDDSADVAYFQKLIADHRITGLVLGLAVGLNGHEGPKAQECRAFGEWLSVATGLEVAFADERFTSAAADDIIRETKPKKGKRNGRRDTLAATLILQGFLAGGCEPYRPLTPVIED